MDITFFDKMAYQAVNAALEFAAQMAEESIRLKNPEAIPAAI